MCQRVSFGLKQGLPLCLWLRLFGGSCREGVATLGLSWRCEMRARAAQTAGVEMIFVRQVYQYAQRGTKAVVAFDTTAEHRDAWFWWSRVNPGQMAAVRISTGWGPHTQRDGVVYVGSELTGSGICEVLSARDVTRARRHYERSIRNGPSAAG